MDDFLNLYKKVKGDAMLFYCNSSEKFTPQGTEGTVYKAI